MIWWFLILACSAGAVVWAALALYIHVRQQMKKARTRKTSGEGLVPKRCRRSVMADSTDLLSRQGLSRWGVYWFIFAEVIKIMFAAAVTTGWQQLYKGKR